MDDFDDMSDTSDLGDMDDAIALGNHRNPIFIENVALLAVECIKYYLKWNNFRWLPPINPAELHRYAQYEYFTPEIGKALVHHCMTSEILVLVAMTEFNVEEWLRLTVEEARVYVDEHFHDILFVLPPIDEDQFRHLYLWAFACYLCLRAVKSNRRIFVSHVLSRLINVAYSSVDISEHYYFLNVKATFYNHIHEVLHDLSDDEGHRTNRDGVDDGVVRFRD
ncbi:hypothetical protein AVEN_161702-1 [Araneus ventricosus]|uniref:Uncharacterized protein n=1 Tax=Araneus ventricosus TaxID=182803 RepID=A0A4Y2KCL7_ARAVE|nr:hypothetical protein AVEN_161702-1 [Araneus ventricosus]